VAVAGVDAVVPEVLLLELAILVPELAVAPDPVRVELDLDLHVPGDHVQGPGELVHHCHCGICRKVSGTPFTTMGGFPAADFGFLRGADGIRGYRSSPGTERRFCGRCGSIVPGDAFDGTVFAPFEGFRALPFYRGYSEPFFDGRHFVIRRFFQIFDIFGIEAYGRCNFRAALQKFQFAQAAFQSFTPAAQRLIDRFRR
jgi:hypothetical protein